MADYDTWKKVGRYVKRGAKGCAIFPSRALNPRMRYIFDISDTGGKNVKLTWDLEGENLKDYVDFLVSEGQIEQYQNDLEASKAEYDKPFAYSKELEEKLSRQCELNAQLDLENAKAVDADLSGPEEEREACLLYTSRCV